MRATLEQLKAIDEKKLTEMWWRGDFPFDHAEGCNACLATHAIAKRCSVRPDHSEIIKNARGLSPFELHSQLERYYALRIFYDSLYEQTVEAAPQIEQAIAESVVHAEVVE